jgi:hypothetical protein
MKKNIYFLLFLSFIELQGCIKKPTNTFGYDPNYNPTCQNCVLGTPKNKMLTIFDANEFEKYSSKGSSSIKGQAFMKTAGGEVRYGAGETVYLVPLTSYTTELKPYIQKEQALNVYGRETSGTVEKNLDGVDVRWRKYLKTTTADGSGNFEFSGLSEGEYYIQCPVFWEIPERVMNRNTGAVVSISTKLSKGEIVKVILKDE